MNVTYFILKRLILNQDRKRSISKIIQHIAVFAIAIGFLVMMIAISSGKGLQNKIKDNISAFNGHIIVTNYDNNQSEVSVSPITLHQKFIEKLKNKNIIYVQPTASKAGIARTETTFEGVLLKGVSETYNWKNIQPYVLKGRVPNTSNFNNEILISQTLSNKLQKKINNTLNVYFLKENATQSPNFRVFKIVGIYSSGVQEIDESTIIGNLKHIQKMNKWSEDQVGNFELFVSNINEIPNITQNLYNDLPFNLDCISIFNKYPYIFEWLQLFDFNIFLLIVIMLFVSIVNIIVVLLVLTFEKSNFIGVLKAIGANDFLIKKIFIANSAYIILKGLVVGNVFSFLILLIQKKYEIIKLDPVSYYVTVAPVEIKLKYFLFLNILTIFSCFISLFLPAIVISKKRVIDIIKFS